MLLTEALQCLLHCFTVSVSGFVQVVVIPLPPPAPPALEPPKVAIKIPKAVQERKAAAAAAREARRLAAGCEVCWLCCKEHVHAYWPIRV